MFDQVPVSSMHEDYLENHFLFSSPAVLPLLPEDHGI